MKIFIIEFDDGTLEAEREPLPFRTAPRLTEKDVKNIRKNYSKGGITYNQLAVKYSVHPATIGKIIRRQVWRKVR